MATRRIDGSSAATSLIERITIEDSVGSNLAPRTRNEYARKINKIADILKSNGDELTPLTASKYLKEKFDTNSIAQSTGRALKAASLYWLAEEAQRLVGQGSNIADYEEAYDKVRELQARSLPRVTHETSSMKLKYFPKEMLDNFIENAEKSSSRYIPSLVAFIEANLLIGLRPSEWFDTNFFSYLSEGNKKSLAISVKNAKTSNGRANGERREIILHNISNANLSKLLLMQEIIASFASKYPASTSSETLTKEFFVPLQKTLNSQLRRLGYPKDAIPTLYSTRHQAVANAKSSGITDRELAALFGHSSTKTQKRHYGKKMHGWAKTSFRPSLESLALVSSKNNSHDTMSITQRTRLAQEAAQWTEGIKGGGSQGGTPQGAGI